MDEGILRRAFEESQARLKKIIRESLAKRIAGGRSPRLCSAEDLKNSRELRAPYHLLVRNREKN